MQERSKELRIIAAVILIIVAAVSVAHGVFTNLYTHYQHPDLSGGSLWQSLGISLLPRLLLLALGILLLTRCFTAAGILSSVTGLLYLVVLVRYVVSLLSGKPAGEASALYAENILYLAISLAAYALLGIGFLLRSRRSALLFFLGSLFYALERASFLVASQFFDSFDSSNTGFFITQILVTLFSSVFPVLLQCAAWILTGVYFSKQVLPAPPQCDPSETVQYSYQDPSSRV